MHDGFPPKNCPHCNALLDDGDIYEHYLKEYGDEKKALETAGDFGWTKEDPHHFSRIMGIYSYVTDRCESWECPDCKKEIIRYGKSYRPTKLCAESLD